MALATQLCGALQPPAAGRILRRAAALARPCLASGARPASYLAAESHLHGGAAAARPADPRWRENGEALVAAQPFMQHLGVTVDEQAPGMAVLSLPVRPELRQQTGFIHAGVTAALADNAGGTAAITLAPVGATVLSAEFHTRLLSPAHVADGGRLVAVGRVVKAGRTLTTTSVEVFTEAPPAPTTGGKEGACGARKLVAWMTQSLVVVHPDKLQQRKA